MDKKRRLMVVVVVLVVNAGRYRNGDEAFLHQANTAAKKTTKHAPEVLVAAMRPRAMAK